MQAALYYEQINEVMQVIFHEIQVQKNDLAKFKQQWEGKNDIPDNITFALNARQSRITRFTQSYHFVGEYMKSLEQEVFRLENEVRELKYKIKYEALELYEIQAKHRAYEKPIPVLGNVIGKWCDQLNAKTAAAPSDQIIPSHAIKHALFIQKQNYETKNAT